MSCIARTQGMTASPSTRLISVKWRPNICSRGRSRMRSAAVLTSVNAPDGSTTTTPSPTDSMIACVLEASMCSYSRLLQLGFVYGIKPNWLQPSSTPNRIRIAPGVAGGARNRPSRRFARPGLRQRARGTCGRDDYSRERRWGKRTTSRMVSVSVKSIASRSTPMPNPPLGGMP